MKLVRDVSITAKLRFIIMVTSLVALLLSAAGFLTYELVMYRRGMIADVSTLAQIIGANCTAALAFNDSNSAEEMLHALRAEEHVLRACIYRKDGRVFATYVRNADVSSDFPPVQPDGQRFQDQSLILFREVVLDNESLGTIFLQSEISGMYRRLALYGAIVAVLSLTALLVALLVSSRLQRLVSQPVLDLARTARMVSTQRNYAIRAEKHSEDELGVLVEDFNEMLSQIQQRDKALQQANDELERRVQERTAELQKSEDAIKLLNAGLEQRVKERTAELEAANKELEAFSYSVSHDLRAPLRKVDGFCQALYEDYSGRLDDTGKDYLQRARAASQHMAELIDHLLKLSQVTRIEMRRETVNLSAMANTIASELQQSEPNRTVNFRIAGNIKVNGDAGLLRAALENLIGNAWKFTRKSHTPVIEFGQTNNNGKPVLYVKDNGAGFNMNYSDKLFAPFQRLHSTTEFEGTGVGLATVQRIINRHGGKLWAEGAINEGATIYFTL